MSPVVAPRNYWKTNQNRQVSQMDVKSCHNDTDFDNINNNAYNTIIRDIKRKVTNHLPPKSASSNSNLIVPIYNPEKYKTPNGGRDENNLRSKASLRSRGNSSKPNSKASHSLSIDGDVPMKVYETISEGLSVQDLGIHSLKIVGLDNLKDGKSLKSVNSHRSMRSVNSYRFGSSSHGSRVEKPFW